MKGSRPTPIRDEHVPGRTGNGRMPEREELRRFLLQYSQHRFAPVGIEGVIISYNSFNTFKPDGWMEAERVVQHYGYKTTPKTAWPQLVKELTGLRVATHGESLAAGRHWNAKLDEPMDYTPYREEERHGLPVFQVWRDVLAWDFRQRSYVPVAKMSAWCVR